MVDIIIWFKCVYTIEKRSVTEKIGCKLLKLLNKNFDGVQEIHTSFESRQKKGEKGGTSVNIFVKYGILVKNWEEVWIPPIWGGGIPFIYKDFFVLH